MTLPSLCLYSPLDDVSELIFETHERQNSALGRCLYNESTTIRLGECTFISLCVCIRL